jgi:molybdate transport system permease protein
MRARFPITLIALAVIGLLLVLLPLLGLALRAPWSEVGDVVTDPVARQALRISMIVSLGAAGLSVLFGVPIAWLLARVPFRGRPVVRALVILPIVLPPVVGGVGLLAALGRNGVVGAWLRDALGIQLTFTTLGAVVAATFVSLPLVVLAVEAGFRSLDARYEQIGATLGASPGYALRRISLPMLAPQLVAGAVLAWARALGEFGATITFAGNLPGRTQTLPLAIFEEMQTDPDGAILLSVVLVVISIGVLVTLRHRITGAA